MNHDVVDAGGVVIEADLVQRAHQTRAPSASSHSAAGAQSSPRRVPIASSPRLTKGWKSRLDEDEANSFGRSDSSPTLSSSIQGHTGRSISESHRNLMVKSIDKLHRRTGSYLLGQSMDNNSERAHGQVPHESDGSQATQEKTSSTMSLRRLVRIVTGMRSSRQGTHSDLFGKSGEDDAREAAAPALHHGGTLLCALVRP
jgi:hypothetical protein